MLNYRPATFYSYYNSENYHHKFTVPTLGLRGSSPVLPGLLEGRGDSSLPVGTVGSYLPLYNSGRYDTWVP